MSRIRYLAVLCSEPASLASFYCRNFGMRELARFASGDVSLTDGGFNLSLFKRRPELREPRMELGLNHIGIAVDDCEAAIARYRAFNPRGVVVAESGDLQHGDVRIHDPECNPVTLSQTDFGLRGEEAKIPRIAHIALNAIDTELVFAFYREVFGFRELLQAHRESSKRPGYCNKHVGDGHSNVAIQAFYNDEVGYEPRFGVAHFGFLVNDSKATAEEVQSSGASVKARPAVRTQSEIRMRDPEGNGCDLSQRGWEVDVDKWARVGAA
jgi:catechol 2,3-dioxygenase-like lactoylglutathione lyase family enzyme